MSGAGACTGDAVTGAHAAGVTGVTANGDDAVADGAGSVARSGWMRGIGTPRLVVTRFF